MKTLITIIIFIWSIVSFADDSSEIQRTLSIIKPDAVSKNHVGDIIARLERQGLKVVALKMMHLSPKQAGDFYAVHANKPFFHELQSFMSSGPIVVQVLEGVDAIAKNREIMGATDPSKAKPGTIRADFAESMGKNAVHGSDSLETAAQEIAFFFPELESRK